MKTQLLGGVERERRFAVVLGTNDDIQKCLKTFASSLGSTGHVHGIGAVRRAAIAFWDPQSLAYQRIEIEEQAEVVSLIGNIALTAGEFQLHAHVVLGMRDGRAVGGHLMVGVVHPTLELLFLESSPMLRRRKDASTGLELLDLS